MKSGITFEMIDGGREVYHSKKFKSRTGYNMLLWTIVDRNVYVETGYESLESIEAHEHMQWWHNHLEAVMGHFDFPKHVQFWTRVGSETLNFEQYNNRKFD